MILFMCFNWYIKQKYGISPPNPLVDIGFSDLQMIVRAEFPDAQIYLSDSYYKTTTLDELRRFLEWDKTDERTYTSEWFDCDDFSTVLTGDVNIPGWEWLPFGMLWTETGTGGHAVNVFIDDKSEIYIVEPQNDQIFKCPGDWKPYLVII